jgi:hypothetical protein
MDRSRTFVKRGRTSTAAIVDELHATAIPDSETADTLWKLVDKNADGVLSRSEFSHAVAVIKKQAADDVSKRLELESGLEQSKRRSSFLCAIVGFLVLTVTILLAGNGALVYGLLEATKETHISASPPEGHQPTRLVDTNANSVSTATATRHVDLVDLPSHPEYLDTLTELTFDHGGTMLGFKIVGFAYYNSTDLDLYLQPEYTMHITPANFVLSAGHGLPSDRRRRLQVGEISIPVGIGIAAAGGIITDSLKGIWNWAWGR